MGRFVAPTTARVDLGEGDWIDLRALTFGDRLAIQEALIGEQTSLEKIDTLHHRAGDLELIRRSLVAWGGPGFCSVNHGENGAGHSGECPPRPITTENLEQLDGTTGERILIEIRKRRVTHSADLKGTPSGSISPASRSGSAGGTGTSPLGSTTSSSASSTAGPGTN